MKDTYGVVRREAAAIVDGLKCGFTVLRYYATYQAREPRLGELVSDPYVQVWADGSLTLIDGDKKIFLYDDQWRGIVKAIGLALEEKQESKKRSEEEWLEKTANSTEFHGVRVDLSRAQVIDVLMSCQIDVDAADRAQPVILYKGVRHGLCRTDLMDDVATGLCEKKTPEEWRAHYLHKAQRCMGGRIKDQGNGRIRFSVIDSFTDG